MSNDVICVVMKSKGTFSLKKGECVLSILLENHLLNDAHCGGNGTCGRCIVRFIKGAPAPGNADRIRFTPGQLRQGYRLACQAHPLEDCIMECMFEEPEEFIMTDSVLSKEQTAKREQKSPKDKDGNFIEESFNAESIKTTSIKTGTIDAAKDQQTMSQVILKVMPNDFGDTFIAVDLGTTTIVMQLVEKETGKIIDTYSCMNPQRRFGSDVITRMQKAMQGDADLLSESVRYCLESGAEKWLMAGFTPLYFLIAGNTVMSHLFMQYDVSSLSVYPFKPKTLNEISLEISDIPGYFLPGMSAFVGGDILSGLYAVHDSARKEKCDTYLFIDLGTNGEIVLVKDGRVFCTATAAGPAFEGGATANVPGADMIELTKSLLSKGIIDETGLISEEHFHQGITVNGVFLRQEDIRGLQVAKAAVYAGIQILLNKAELKVNEIQKVYLAGGFGYKLDVNAACCLGLIPSELENRTMAVGNTSIYGAVLYGMDKEKGDTFASALKENVMPVNLAEEMDFQKEYIAAMNLKRL